MALFAIMLRMTPTKKTPRHRRQAAPSPRPASSVTSRVRAGVSVSGLSGVALTVAFAGTLTGLSATLSEGRAEAKILELYGDVYLGGMYGTEPKFKNASIITAEPSPMGQYMGADYYNDNSGGLIGAKVGIELLYTDLYVQFDQAISPRGFSGSAVQAMLGWDLSMGPSKWKGTFGGYGGMVFAFPYTPHFPIDRDQIAKIGVAAELQAGAEYVFHRLLRLQFLGTFGYHYMFAGAKDVPIDLDGNYQSTRTHGFHFLAKAGIRFNLGI